MALQRGTCPSPPHGLRNSKWQLSHFEMFGCGGSPGVLLTCCEPQHDPKVTPGGTDRSRKMMQIAPTDAPKSSFWNQIRLRNMFGHLGRNLAPGGAGDSNPGPLGTKSRVLDHSAPRGHSPGRSAPRGIIPLGDHPLGNRPPGESSPRVMLTIQETLTIPIAT